MFIITKDGKSAKLASNVTYISFPLEHYLDLTKKAKEGLPGATIVPWEKLETSQYLKSALIEPLSGWLDGRFRKDFVPQFIQYYTYTSSSRYVRNNVGDVLGFVPDIYYPQSIEDYSKLGIYSYNSVYAGYLGTLSFKHIREQLIAFMRNNLGAITENVSINTFTIYRPSFLFDKNDIGFMANLGRDTKDGFILGFNVGGVNGENYGLFFDKTGSYSSTYWTCRFGYLDLEKQEFLLGSKSCTVPQELMDALLSVKAELVSVVEEPENPVRFYDGMTFL